MTQANMQAPKNEERCIGAEVHYAAQSVCCRPSIAAERSKDSVSVYPPGRNVLRQAWHLRGKHHRIDSRAVHVVAVESVTVGSRQLFCTLTFPRNHVQRRKVSSFLADNLGSQRTQNLPMTFTFQSKLFPKRVPRTGSRQLHHPGQLTSRMNRTPLPKKVWSCAGLTRFSLPGH